METNKKIGIIALTFLTVLSFFKFRKKQLGSNINLDQFPSKVVEKLSLKEVVEYFKEQNLNVDIHTPFLALEFSERRFPEKEGFRTIFAGVYNEKLDVISGVLHYVKDMSDDIKELMGKNNIVVLS